VNGPTRGQARGKKWRRSSYGLYVPAAVDGTVVEQRILEQSVRVPDGTGVTGWASLRWRGGNYFDGVDRFTGVPLPVPVALGGLHEIGHGGGAEVSHERLTPQEVECLEGVPCTIAERALFDEIRRTRDRRSGVVTLEMAVAAGLLSFESFGNFVEPGCSARTGVPFVREVIDWAGGDTRSPPEALMRLVWKYDAGYPEPLCNKPVFDLDGNLLGIPDLLDPVAGVAGEYGGSDHTETDQRRDDRVREDRLVAHGLSFFEVVTGDLANRPLVVRRMQSARARALFLPTDRRTWTLDPPHWWPAYAARMGL
jgi:hypothetical protein